MLTAIPTSLLYIGQYCPDIDGDYVFSPFFQKDSLLYNGQYCPDIDDDYVLHHFVKKILRFISDNIALILTVIMFFTILSKRFIAL